MRTAIILVHLLFIGAYPIYGALLTLHRHYAVAYGDDTTSSSPRRINCAGLTNKQCDEERIRREDDWEKIMKEQKIRVQKYLPHSIIENSLLTLFGLLSIVGTIGFIRKKRWSTALLPVTTIAFTLWWLPYGIYGLPFTITLFCSGLFLLIFIFPEISHLKKLNQRILCSTP